MFASGVTIALFPKIEDREKVTIPGMFVVSSSGSMRFN
jgi:hypothetical protein